jgi:hypothetical protein
MVLEPQKASIGEQLRLDQRVVHEVEAALEPAVNTPKYRVVGAPPLSHQR